MIAPLPPYKRRTAKELARIGLVILLALTPVGAKAIIDRKAKYDTRAEYRASRALVLARIDAAVANSDLDTLTRIHNRYVHTVKDREYHQLISSALAKLIARETRMELSASRNLDISRNREEASNKPDTSRPQVPVGMEATQTLSVLPY
ncbi:MAG: hypothetical protein EOP85_22250 [Verrucomicrobiaceae bacterium]|nr:MAG: hypothetical protein EOP85_22250 [Verrucomicrobiaceae bacterium]